MHFEHINNRKFKYSIFFFILIVLLSTFLLLFNYPPTLSEGWFSDIAYHLNWKLIGWMAKDIPFGVSWSDGIGKLYFFIHFIFYKLFGVGLFQARLVTFVSGVFLLIYLYRWTRSHINTETALITTLLLSASTSFYLPLTNARYDVILCLLSFCSFYLISSAINYQKNNYFLYAGFICAIAVDICYRGIVIVIAVYLYHCFFFERKTFIKRSMLLLTGSFIAFIYWFSVNVVPIGLSDFINYRVPSSEGSSLYLLSEIDKLISHLSKGSRGKIFFTWIELIYLAGLLIIFYKYRSKYSGVTKLIIAWVVAVAVAMTFIDNAAHAPYLLMYSPPIYILCGIGLQELFLHKKKLAYFILTLAAIIGLSGQGARFIKYYYYSHIEKSYDLNGYYQKLRSRVDLNESIIGATNHWYGFPDTQYYGGHFYLHRVISVLNELELAADYNNDYERAKGLLNVFKKRKIRYLIADGQFKPFITPYFPENKLPGKNFLLLDTISDYYLGCAYNSTHPCKTEIYKIVSYEP